MYTVNMLEQYYTKLEDEDYESKQIREYIQFEDFCNHAPNEDDKHSGNGGVTEKGDEIVLDYLEQKPYHGHHTQKRSRYISVPPQQHIRNCKLYERLGLTCRKRVCQLEYVDDIDR